MNFNEALERFTNTDPQEVAAVAHASTMKDDEIEKLIAAFEASAQFDETGVELWTARTLQKLLDYSDYRNFLNIVDKAKTSCRTAGQPPEDHFVDITEMVELGSGATREIDDIKLSRYACYLITQNGNAKKRPVAFGQTYFAIQTRKQELADQVASGDAARLGRQHIRAGVISLRTEKTGTPLAIPVLSALQEIIDASPTGDLALIARLDGRPMTKEGFGNWFRAACKAAGVPGSAHGLRKAGATRCAEAGATIHELNAIFGWSGTKMAAHYTEKADRARLAARAMEKMER